MVEVRGRNGVVSGERWGLRMRVESKAFRTVRQEHRGRDEKPGPPKNVFLRLPRSEAYPTMVVRNVGSADPPSRQGNRDANP